MAQEITVGENSSPPIFFSGNSGATFIDSGNPLIITPPAGKKVRLERLISIRENTGVTVKSGSSVIIDNLKLGAAALQGNFSVGTSSTDVTDSELTAINSVPYIESISTGEQIEISTSSVSSLEIYLSYSYR